MKIIVVGGGKVGTALCRSLVEEKHDVILIEEKEAVLKNITKRHDIMGIVGNGANFKILEQADVANCDIFIALTDKDEVNMISAVLAKQMGAKETVVRVRNPEYSNSYFKDKNFLGFSLVVNPELLTARYIANSVDFPNALSVEHFVNGRVMLMEFMISIGLCIAMIMGGHFITSGAITTGDFTAFLLALTAAYKPAKSITGTGESMQHGILAAEVLFDFLDSKPDIVDAPDAKELTAKKLSVDFDDVSFEYVAGEPVLRNVSLHAPAGTVCAFVGESGGGKTTMFNLIQRFYEPQFGKIAINRTNINKYTLKSLRENISEVSQDVFLFNDTVEANIKYARPDATHDEVIAAARAANAHDFIMELPNGYDSPVGEAGGLLSGGQKQRIAIARAILKDAPILLLDEATSALDTQSEKLIQAALKDLMVGRTTFVIAHRLSTILDADMIYVIKNGQIIEHGIDAELCELGGEYKRLRDIQFKTKTKKGTK